MANYYLDLVNGNDANDGSSWANAWKTIRNGATAARIAAGDTIKIAKTADPTSLGVNATFTQRSNSVTLASALTANIDLCESAWTSDGGADVVCSTQSALNQGSYSAQMQIKAAFGTGLAAHREITEVDLSGYQNVAFYIYASANVAANSLRLDLCSDTAGTTPVDSVTIPFAIVGGEKYPYVYKKGSALGSSIKSVALTVLSDLGSSDVNVRLDNILACNNLHLNCLLGKSGGPYLPVGSINGTSVTLASYDYYNQLSGVSWLWSETVAAYVCEVFRVDVSFGSTQECYLNDSGTSFDSVITFAGGYNTSSGSQDGMTWIAPKCYDVDGGNRPYILDMNGKDFVELQNIGFAQCPYALYMTADADGTVINGCSFSGITDKGIKIYTYDQSHAMMLKGSINIYSSGPFYLPFHQSGQYAGGGIMQDADSVLSVYHPGNSTMLFIAGGCMQFLGKVYLEETNYYGYGINISSLGEDSYFNEIELKNVYYGLTGSSFGNINIDKLTVTGGSYIFYGNAETFGRVRIGRYTQVSGSPTEYTPSAEGTNYQKCQDFICFDHYKADDRWKAIGRFGNISDHITGGQAASWAYGGTGLSMLLSPTSQTIPLRHSFIAPVASGSALKLRMQVRKTSAAAGCRLFVSIAGAGCTPIFREEVTLTDSWAEYASSSFTPTRNGFITICLQAYDGSTTGDIGIDEITVAAA